MLVGIKLLMRTETGSRDERSHLSKRGSAPQLLPFNDADEVSCRAGAIKCSRCRASFAPICAVFSAQNLVPPLDRPLTGPLSETKNCPKHLVNSNSSQASRTSTQIRIRESNCASVRPIQIEVLGMLRIDQQVDIIGQ